MQENTEDSKNSFWPDSALWNELGSCAEFVHDLVFSSAVCSVVLLCRPFVFQCQIIATTTNLSTAPASSYLLTYFAKCLRLYLMTPSPAIDDASARARDDRKYYRYILYIAWVYYKYTFNWEKLEWWHLHIDAAIIVGRLRTSLCSL